MKFREDKYDSRVDIFYEKVELVFNEKIGKGYYEKVNENLYCNA